MRLGPARSNRTRYARSRPAPPQRRILYALSLHYSKRSPSANLEVLIIMYISFVFILFFTLTYLLYILCLSIFVSCSHPPCSQICKGATLRRKYPSFTLATISRFTLWRVKGNSRPIICTQVNTYARTLPRVRSAPFAD